MRSLSGCPLPIRFLSSASVLLPATWPLFLPFRSSRFCLTVASPVHPSAFASLAFPVLSDPISRVFFPGSRTRLPVCFLSSLPISLPQPFHRCFPLAFAFGLSPRFRFLSSASARLRLLSLPFFPFPSSRSPLSAVPTVLFPLPSGLFPCLPSDSGTRPAAFPFSARRFATQQLPLRLSLLPFGFRPFPLAFALGSGYLASGLHPFQVLPIRSKLASRSELLHTTIQVRACQHLF